MRDQVHHVRVTFHIHQVANLDRTRLTYTPNIIASQVNQHNVLSTFLFIIAQLLLQHNILIQAFSSWSGASKRTGHYHTILYPHQNLRGGPDNAKAAETEKE